MSDHNVPLRKILITSRLGKIEGFTNEKIAYFDLYDQKSQKIVRNFILLNQSVKLMYEPFGWKDMWYVDLIQIQRINDHEINLIDLYLDVIIYNNCKSYKIIDFDDLAKALVEGKVDVHDLEIPLKGFQNFLDNYIYTLNFPPLEIKDLI